MIELLLLLMQWLELTMVWAGTSRTTFQAHEYIPSQYQGAYKLKDITLTNYYMSIGLYCLREQTNRKIIVACFGFRDVNVNVYTIGQYMLHYSHLLCPRSLRVYSKHTGGVI